MLPLICCDGTILFIKGRTNFLIFFSYSLFQDYKLGSLSLSLESNQLVFKTYISLRTNGFKYFYIKSTAILLLLLLLKLRLPYILPLWTCSSQLLSSSEMGSVVHVVLFWYPILLIPPLSNSLNSNLCFLNSERPLFSVWILPPYIMVQNLPPCGYLGQSLGSPYLVLLSQKLELPLKM